MNLLFHILFFIFSLYILLKAVFYGFYELKSENNKVGGVAVICFSIIVVILTNIVLLFR